MTSRSGIRLAYELGRPVVNGASTLAVEDSPDGPVVVAVGEGPDGQETYRVPLPAVVTIREGGVEPRYPSVPGRLKAKKVPIEERQPVAAPTGSGRVRLRAATADPERGPDPRRGARRPPRPWSTSSRSWECWRHDPHPRRDRPRGREPRRSRSRPSPSPVTSRPRATASPSTRSSSATSRTTCARSSRRTASAPCTGSAATTSRRTPARAGPRRSGPSSRRPARSW